MPTRRLTTEALDEEMPAWGVSVLESHHAPEFSMEWRTHPFLKVVYALAGEGTFHIGRAAYPFVAGDLMVTPPGRRNRIVDAPGRPVSVYVLCVSRDLLAFDPGVERRLVAGRWRLPQPVVHRVQTLFRRVSFSQRRSSGEQSLAMVVDALALVQVALDAATAGPSVSHDPEDEDAMARYVEQLRDNFFEAGGIDDAAAQLGMSRRTFTQRFREATGESWLAYVRGRAIEHACSLLTETSKSIVSIAFECGFSDLSSFYRHFKAKTGASPAAWRRTR